MMSEYRVVRKTIYNGDGETDIDFVVCAVFYDRFDGSVRFIDTAECIRSTSLSGALFKYEAMGQAFDRPVIDFDTRKELSDADLYQI